MTFCFNPPFLYFFSRLRNILSQMSPSDISFYLSTNILTLGITSLMPMIYLSLDTIQCASNADRTQNVYNQCSGISIPQISICAFLLNMMIVKVLIAPLPTTTITAKDLIKLNLPRRLIFQGALFGLSFLLNLYLFANMEEGKVTDSITTIGTAANILAFIPLFIELSHMVFHRAHRTSLAPRPSTFHHISPILWNLPHRHPLSQPYRRRHNRRIRIKDMGKAHFQLETNRSSYLQPQSTSQKN